MADGTPVDDFARRLALLPATIVETTTDAVTAAAEVLEDTARDNVRRDSGGDGVLSRVRSGRGARVDVELRVTGAGSRAAARVIPVGPVLLIEDDTRPHVEPFQYVAQRTGGARTYSMARRRKAARRGFIYIPGVGVRAQVRHRGTKGKRPITRAFESSADEAGAAGLDVYTDAISKHLGR